MSRPVHIVAVGARTPVGLCAASSAAAVRAGISRLRAHPFMVDLRGEPVVCAIDGKLDPGQLGHTRLHAMLASALGEVAQLLTRSGQLAGASIPCWLGLPEPRPGFTQRDAARSVWSMQQLAVEGAGVVQYQPLAKGHAAGFEALASAFTAVSSGGAAIGLVLAGDSYIDPDTLLWLESTGRLKTSDARSAFAPGEGAACVALASDAARRQLALPSLGVVRAVGIAQEPNAFVTGQDNLGKGLTAAIADVTALLQRGETIGDIYCDINGERQRVEEWGFAALRTQRAFEDVSRFTTAVPEWGDLGAASGAASVVLAVRAWQRRSARGRLALSWGSSDQGLCGAALLEQPRGDA